MGTLTRHLSYIWLILVVIGIILIYLGLPYKINPEVIIDLEMLINPLNYNNVTYPTIALDLGILCLLLAAVVRAVRWDDLWRSIKF